MSVWLSGFPDGVFRELCECARICSESMHAQFCAHNQWWCSPRTDEHFFRPNQIHRYWIMIMLFVCAANANAVHCGAIRASWIKCYIVMYICMLLSSNCFRFHTYTHTARTAARHNEAFSNSLPVWRDDRAVHKWNFPYRIISCVVQRSHDYNRIIISFLRCILKADPAYLFDFVWVAGWPTGHVWWILFVASVFRCGAA